MRKQLLLLLIPMVCMPAGVVRAQAVYDSAGMRVYGYRLVAPRHAFVVSDSPVVHLKGRAYDGTSVLGATAMLRLSDGRIAVAVSYTTGPVTVQVVDGPRPTPPARDTTAPLPRPRPFTDPDQRSVREVRIFDRSGTLLTRLTERDPAGDLAGFPSVVTLLSEPRPGQLFVGSALLGWNLFDATTGQLLLHLPRSSAFGRPFGTLSNGSVVTGHSIPGALARAMLVNGYRVAIDSMRVRMASVRGDTLQWMNWFARMPRSAAPLPTDSGNTPVRRGLVPWPVDAQPIVVGANRIWSFDALTWELRMADETGSMRAVIRPPVPDRIAKASLGDVFVKDSSYTHAMVVDDRGRLWFDGGHNEVQFTNDFSVREWYVFGTDGMLIGSVAMPAGFRPMHVAGDELLGLYRPSALAGWATAVFRITPSASK